MELKQLRYFVAVGEELHFGRAAKRVNISQPPLSMQIRNLEEELGTALFKRSSRRVELTEPGRVFLEEVHGILDALDKAVGKTRDAAKGYAGRLAIGFMGPAMDSFLPRAIRIFREKHPGIRLVLSEMSTNDQLQALHAGKIRAGFVRIYRNRLKGLDRALVWQEPYVLALPKGDPLSHEKEVGVGQLKGRSMILFPRKMQPMLYDDIMACFKNEGFEPQIAQEASTKKTTVALVAAGLGLAIVPESSRTLRAEDVVYRPISDPARLLPGVEITLAWRTGDDAPFLRRFLASVLNRPV